ncbi:MAG: mechanosensitive ion channel domain-containing protein [Candidatus Omnitrophota bacterium]
MNNYLYSGILIVSASIAGWVVYLLLAALFKQWNRAVPLKELRGSWMLLNNPLRFLFPFLGIAAAINYLRITEKERLFISHFVNISLIALFGWVSVKIIRIVRDVILSRYDIESRDNMRARGMHTQLRVITNIINVAIVLLTFSFILMTFPEVRHIGVSILASAGIIGIVIGFAAQRTLGNLIAGIQIAIAQPIRLDDVVIVENEWGWVEEITLTYAVVRIWDLRRLIVPISYFLEKPFQNWTRVSADLLGTVYIYVDYSIPLKDVRGELARILDSSPLWDKKVGLLQVTNMTEKSVELRALVSAANSSTLWDLRCETREKLLEFLQERFPGSLPRIRVEMKN